MFSVASSWPEAVFAAGVNMTISGTLNCAPVMLSLVSRP